MQRIQGLDLLPLLLLLLLLLLPPSRLLTVAVNLAGGIFLGSQQQQQPLQCAWRICHSVIVENSPEPARWRSLVLHRCASGNNFPEKCYLPEVVEEPSSVLNFTMRKAELAAAPLTDFCMFKKLWGLDLSENMIAEFVYPENMPIDCLAQLRWISLRENWLRSVDISQFLHLPALEKLDLSENRQLESLYVTSLTPGTRLKAIMASKCRIKQVDIALVRLPSLQDVDLNYNQISVVTNRLNWRWTLKDVRDIEAERNRRKSLDPHYYARLSIQTVQNQFGPEAFGRNRLWGLPVPDLQEAADSHAPNDPVVDQLRHYRDAFQSFVYVDNTESTITCDCHLFHAWQYFKRVYSDPRVFSKRNALSIADWVSLKCDTTAAQRELRYQTIATLRAPDLACSQFQGCPFGCVCTELVQPSQMIVDCRSADLPYMPDKLPKSIHPVRYVLLLSGNRISAIRSIAQSELVQEIDLSSNLLGPDTDFAPLTEYTQVHSIDLSNNTLLTELSPSLINASLSLPVGVFRLSSEILRCRCGLFDTASWQSLRRLAGIQRELLRCRLESDELRRPAQILLLTDFRRSNCVAPQINTTVLIITQQPEVASSSTLLVVIVPLVVLVIIVIVAATLYVTLYRHRHRGSALQQQQLQSNQQYRSEQFSQSPYDTATPRYVISSSSRLYSDPKLEVAGLPLVPLPQTGLHDLQSPLLQRGNPSGDSIGVPARPHSSRSSDLSSGDLSDNDDDDNESRQRRSAQANELPPPLPPRPPTMTPSPARRPLPPPLPPPQSQPLQRRVSTGRTHQLGVSDV